MFAESARFIRVGRNVEELSENRPGDVEVCADVDATLDALLDCEARPANPDKAWRNGLLKANAEKTQAMTAALATQPSGTDGRMHPL